MIPFGYSNGGPILVCDRDVFRERWRGVDAPVDLPLPVPNWSWGSLATQGGFRADYDQICDLGAPDFDLHFQFYLNRVDVRGGNEAAFCIAEEDAVGIVADPAGRARFLLTRGAINADMAEARRSELLSGWFDAPPNVKAGKGRELLTVTSGSVVVGDSAASGTWVTDTVAEAVVPVGCYFVDGVFEEDTPAIEGWVSSAIRLVRVPKNRAALVSLLSALIGFSSWAETSQFALSDEWLQRALRLF